MTEASYYHNGCNLDHTPGSAVSAGEVLKLDDDRVAVPANPIGASELGGVDVDQYVYKFTKASGSGVTFAVGDDVYWDASAASAVQPGLDLDGSADHYVGRCIAAAGDSQAYVLVQINLPSRHERLRPFVYEFDCDGDNGDTDEHVLIPASQNPHGLLILGVFGVVTEQMAGSSEDQGIVTVEDEDDNAVCTLTASDSAADAIGDVIVGTSDLYSATTGDAAKTVAAGKAVQGYVSQQTSGGTPAGKMKVYVRAIPLV